MARPLQHALRISTSSPEQTRTLGRKLAHLLAPGDLVCLRGDLGAGKTTLVQGIAEGLETDQPATSPSFTLLHQHQGRLLLHHLDLYRLGPADLADIGVEDLIGGEGVVVVEWAERLPPALAGDRLDIAIEFDPACDEVRHFHLSGRGARAGLLLDQLREENDAHPGD